MVIQSCPTLSTYLKFEAIFSSRNAKCLNPGCILPAVFKESTQRRCRSRTTPPITQAVGGIYHKRSKLLKFSAASSPSESNTDSSQDSKRSIDAGDGDGDGDSEGTSGWVVGITPPALSTSSASTSTATATTTTATSDATTTLRLESSSPPSSPGRASQTTGSASPCDFDPDLQPLWADEDPNHGHSAITTVDFEDLFSSYNWEDGGTPCSLDPLLDQEEEKGEGSEEEEVEDEVEEEEEAKLRHRILSSPLGLFRLARNAWQRRRGGGGGAEEEEANDFTDALNLTATEEQGETLAGNTNMTSTTAEVASSDAEVASSDAELASSKVGLHPVLEVLGRRAMEGSLPGNRSDDHTLALVVQGGGMRGVISGGGLTILHYLGLLRCFDVVFGSSAGAMNLTYFLAEQPEGVRAYIDDLTTPKFVNLMRLIKWLRSENPKGEGSEPATPALDLSVLLDDVMDDIKPLNWDKVINSEIPLKIVASSLDQLRPVVLEDFKDLEDLKTCLRASATIPQVAGGPVEREGERLVDGAVYEGVPLRSALKHQGGCTHALCLVTQFRSSEAHPTHQTKTYRSRWRRFVGKLLHRTVKGVFLNPSYMKEAWAAEEARVAAGQGFDSVLQDIDAASRHPFSKEVQDQLNGAFALGVFPPKAVLGGKNLSPLSLDKGQLELGLQAGMEAMAQVLEPITHYVSESLLVQASSSASSSVDTNSDPDPQAPPQIKNQQADVGSMGNAV